MINSIDIETAVTVARAELAEEHSWITSSALHERAFLIGLHSGLAALAAPEAQAALDRLTARAVAGTAFGRPGDDPFRATKASASLSQFAADGGPTSAHHAAKLVAELRDLVQHT